MAFRFGPSTVTSNLLLHLDVGNPASYPGSGTTWYDLQKRGNSTLANSPVVTMNGAASYITFDGINDYASLADQTRFRIPTLTVCAWVYPLYFSDQGTVIMSIGDSSRLLLGMNYGTAGVPTGGIYFNVVGNVATLNRYTSVPSVRLNNWYHYTFVVDLPGSNIKGYINGVQVYSNTTSYGTDFTTVGANPAIISSRYSGQANQTNMRLSTFLFYNKALTQAEVQQNYNSTKGRFGL